MSIELSGFQNGRLLLFVALVACPRLFVLNCTHPVSLSLTVSGGCSSPDLALDCVCSNSLALMVLGGSLSLSLPRHIIQYMLWDFCSSTSLAGCVFSWSRIPTVAGVYLNPKPFVIWSLSALFVIVFLLRIPRAFMLPFLPLFCVFLDSPTSIFIFLWLRKTLTELLPRALTMSIPPVPH